MFRLTEKNKPTLESEIFSCCSHPDVIIYYQNHTSFSIPLFYCPYCGLKGGFLGDQKREGVYCVSSDVWKKQIRPLIISGKKFSQEKVEKLLLSLEKEKISFKPKNYSEDIAVMEEILKKAGKEAREVMHREQGGRLF